jgi:hypothetical protein
MHGAKPPFLLMCLHDAYRENFTFGGNRGWALWHLGGLRLDDHGLDNLITGDRSPSLDEECQGTRSDITGEGETLGQTGRPVHRTRTVAKAEIECWCRTRKCEASRRRWRLGGATVVFRTTAVPPSSGSSKEWRQQFSREQRPQPPRLYGVTTHQTPI